jgi:hypothetical protein
MKFDLFAFKNNYTINIPTTAGRHLKSRWKINRKLSVRCFMGETASTSITIKCLEI